MRNLRTAEKKGRRFIGFTARAAQTNPTALIPHSLFFIEAHQPRRPKMALPTRTRVLPSATASG